MSPASLHGKKYLIFDFDETIDTLQMDWSQFFTQQLETARQIDPNIQVLPKERGYQLQNRVISQFGKSANSLFIELSHRYERKYYLGHTPHYSVIDFIIQNQDTYTFFMWTNNHRETIVPILEELGLDGAFAKIVSRDVVAFPKPHPYGFSLIHTEGSKKSEYVMIGDSLNDLRAAKGAKIDFIHVEYFQSRLID